MAKNRNLHSLNSKIFFKIVVLGFFVIIIITYVIIVFFSHKFNNHDFVPDEYAHKQWYLYNEYHDNIETNSSNLAIANGFNIRDIIRVDSDINLGTFSLWNGKTSRSNNKEIIIALIDTCVDVHHEDLNKNIWENENEIPDDGIDNDQNGYIDDYYGWNFIENCKMIDKNINEFTHGTHCAGIIAAEHNHIGVMGIIGDLNVKIMVLPAIERGENNEEIQNTINAIRYAESMGAQICNLSCTFSDYSKDLEKAIKSSNMYFVVAAGNFHDRFLNGINLDEDHRYPASYNFSNVITVGSLDTNGKLASTSNYGANTVDITAPGEWIYSTLPNNTYGFMSGTSMAAPIVTSVLALYYIYNDVGLVQAVNMLYHNADHVDTLSKYINNGGIIHFTY